MRRISIRHFMLHGGKTVQRMRADGEAVALTRYGHEVALILPWEMVEDRLKELEGL